MQDTKKMKRIERSFKTQEDGILIDCLEKETGLSKSLIKKIAINGGVWLKKGNSRLKLRVRRAQTKIRKNDQVSLYFDPKIKTVSASEVKEIKSTRSWSVWFKPAGILTQGTKYGDEGSLLREIEKKHKEVYLINRLDRETSGPVVVAYNKKEANYLSSLFQKNQVKKTYKATVLGSPEESGVIEKDIDGKKSLTKYRVLENNESTSEVLVDLITGRKHQIRKHFEAIGHPVMGDPLYGKGNKNKEGLRLSCIGLSFKTQNKDLIKIEL